MVILLAIAIFITMNDSPLINPKNIELNLYAKCFMFEPLSKRALRICQMFLLGME